MKNKLLLLAILYLTTSTSALHCTGWAIHPEPNQVTVAAVLNYNAEVAKVETAARLLHLAEKGHHNNPEMLQVIKIFTDAINELEKYPAFKASSKVIEDRLAQLKDTNDRKLEDETHPKSSHSCCSIS